MRNTRDEYSRRIFESRIRRARIQVERASSDLRKEQVARDEFELRQRPNFPTTEMRLALEVAAKDVKEKNSPASHLGRDVGGGVGVHGETGFIFVHHMAPYGMAANGYLWKFTDAEVGKIEAHLKSLGLKIEAHWPFQQGHTFTVEVAP